MASRSSWRERSPLPEGTLAVGAGLGVLGLGAYAYLVVSARALGPVEFGELSVLWAMVFLVGPGFFIPLEQEVSRAIAGRRVAGVGGAPVIRRALALGGAVAAALVVVTALAGPWLTDHLFGGQALLVVGLALGIVAYMAADLLEGVLSGNGRFRRYGVYIGGEAVVRLAICLLCVALGVRTAGPYGLALGLAPLLMCVPVIWGQGELSRPGPSISWRELSASLGALLAASLLAQVLINAPVILVEVMAPASQAGEVGVFTAALVVARVPLFLSAALQAALLPQLAGLAAAERLDDFVAGLRRLLVLIGVVVVAATLIGFLGGAAVIERLFGHDFPISDRSVGLLALASGAYVLALTLAQALIALDGAVEVAYGWGLGVVALIALSPFGSHDVITRVEVAFVVGGVVSMVAMAGFLVRRVARRRDGSLRPDAPSPRS